MTSGLKSRYYTDTTDGDILDELLGEYGLDRDGVHQAVAQGGRPVRLDRLGLRRRAEANGHVVAVRDGKVTVGPPATDAEPVVTAQFGATVLELDAEIDARWQVKGVTATAWNATDQELVSADASEPSVTDSGNLSASELSDVIGGDPHLLRHGGKLSEPELQAWADGRLLKDRLAKVRGRVRFQGFGGVTAGDVIEVAGIGALRRHAVRGRRAPHVRRRQLGDRRRLRPLPGDHAATYPVTAARGRLLAAVNGLQIGIVTALQDDPDGEDRIKVRLPLVSDSEEGVGPARHARRRRPAGHVLPPRDRRRGGRRLPRRRPALPGGARPAPQQRQAGPGDGQGRQPRQGLRQPFEDEADLRRRQEGRHPRNPGGNKLTLSDDAKTVSLVDQNGNKVTLDDGGITLESAKDLTLKASGDVKLQGTNVECKSQANFKAEGQAGVDVKSSGTLTIKGSLVQIN